jgi:hypothetical protein
LYLYRLTVFDSLCFSKVTTTVGAAPQAGFSLALKLDATLGPEGYTAEFDGNESAVVTGGDRMGVLYGAGAFLRAARYGTDGLSPPQPPPAVPPVPIEPGYWFTVENQSYVYGQVQNDGSGTALVPLLGVFESWDECKKACVTNTTINCTAITFDPQLVGPFNKHCYARHDAIWQPGPVSVPGAFSARRYKLPLPTPTPAPHTVKWAKKDQPTTPNSFRGLYFATHFGNFFANAPASEVHEYLEDMALWGANTLILISEPAKFGNYSALEPLLDRNAGIGAYAQSIGFKVGFIFDNEGFQGHPTNISYTRPVGDSGDFSPLQNLICPAKGLDYLAEEV